MNHNFNCLLDDPATLYESIERKLRVFLMFAERGFITGLFDTNSRLVIFALFKLNGLILILDFFRGEATRAGSLILTFDDFALHLEHLCNVNSVFAPHPTQIYNLILRTHVPHFPAVVDTL